MSKVKCWTEVIPKGFSRAIHRVCNGLKQYAPDNIEIVDNIEAADIQIVHVVGKGEMPLINRKPLNKTIPFMYCFLTSTDGEEPREFWYEVFAKAMLTMTYYDLPSMMKEKYPEIEFSFYRTPVGVDTNVFYVEPLLNKTFSVMSTGYVDWAEKIHEWYDAFTCIGYDVNHAGKDFGYGKNFFAYEDITDEQMRLLYNISKYTNGMRVAEGFEAPVIEGTLCGSRGICFDSPIYRYWFDEIALFVRQLEDPVSMVEEILDVIDTEKGINPISKSELEYTKNRFANNIVYPNMWKAILERI